MLHDGDVQRVQEGGVEGVEDGVLGVDFNAFYMLLDVYVYIYKGWK